MSNQQTSDSDLYLTGAIVIAAGAALVLLFRKREGKRSLLHAEEGHWSPAMRVATGAAGGGLLLYGSQAKGKLAALATTAGTGLLSRSLADEPIADWQEILPKEHLMSLVK